MIPFEGQKLFNDLHAALQRARLCEQEYGKFHPNHKSEEETVLSNTVDEVISKKLPEAMGKFISYFDLQQSFLSLGRYIRTFEDAQFVVDRLKELIVSKAEDTAPDAASRTFEAVIQCCRLMETSVAGLLGRDCEIIRS